MARIADPPASTLLLEEYFSTGDARFLEELYRVRHAARLRAFAERFVADARPFARTALLAYIDDGCDRPFHRALVKHLYKRAEAAGDDEAMAHFLVAFDRLLPRRVLERRRYNHRTRAYERQSELVAAERHPRHKQAAALVGRFTARTRYYLQRRALRYFRHVGRRDVERFGRLARAALALYRDAHLTSAGELLGARSLLLLLYFHSPVLHRTPRALQVREGRTLGELTPAPLFPAAWRGQLDALLAFALGARATVVRQFAVATLRADYVADIAALPLPKLRALLRSEHEEVQALAADALRSASGLGALAVDTWLELLAIDHAYTVGVVCELVVKYVAPERLSLAQCVALSCARPAPVAELGLSWAEKKPVRTRDEVEALLPLANAPAPVVRARAAALLARALSDVPAARPEHVRELLDARHAEARAQGLALLGAAARFRDETLLWAALAESPYDDARAFLVSHLEARGAALAGDALRSVWATALLAVHRGGRAKRAVVGQVAERIAAEPERAAELLPLLAVALRSVRGPERRVALAAVAKAVFYAPALRPAVGRALPELTLFAEGVA